MTLTTVRTRMFRIALLASVAIALFISSPVFAGGTCPVPGTTGC